MGVERPVHQRFTRFDLFAFLHADVDAAGDGVFFDGTVVAFHQDFAHPAQDFAVLDHAVNFAEHGGLFGFAGFEQLDHARQAAGDIFSFGGFARNLGQHVARVDFVVVVHHQVGARRQQVLLAGLASVVLDEHGGLVFFVGGGDSHHALRQAGHFVHLLFDRFAQLQVLELHAAAHFGQDGEGVGVPLHHGLPEGDGLAVFDLDPGAVHHHVAFFLAAFFVHHRQRTVAVHHHQIAAFGFHGGQVAELDEAVVLGVQPGLLSRAGGGAPDVEGAHGELGAGFADGLGGDHAHSFAQLDHPAGGQIAPVAHDADAAPRLTGEPGTNLHPLDARRLDSVGQILGDFMVDVNDDLPFVVLDFLQADPADDAVAQRLYHFARLDDGTHFNAVHRAAVHLAYDDVLGHVHQAPSQVAGVGGLQRRVRQTLASAVGGDEVLQHGQPFAEVGGDGGFDDFARGPGHQAAHAGELPDLLLGAARAGVGHNIDRVELAGLVRLLHALEHIVGDPLGDV